MFPILFSIGSFPIHSYGIFIAIGFVSAVLFMRHQAIKAGLPHTAIVDLCFWCLFLGILGSRVVFIITQWAYYREHFHEIFHIWEGGLVFYGGPIVCIPFFFWFALKKRLPLGFLSDSAAMALTLAHGFGRIGCFAAGCCYGKPTSLSWGMTLSPHLVDPHLVGRSLHPTNLYESVFLFCLFIALFLKNRKKRFDGQIALIYLMSYASFRFLIEFLRGDDVRGFIASQLLSTSQTISVMVLIIASLVYWNKKRNAYVGT